MSGVRPPWLKDDPPDPREWAKRMRKLKEDEEARAREEARKQTELGQEQDNYKDRKDLAQDLLEIIDDEIYEHDRELTWGPVDKRKMRAVVMRQMVRSTLAGMNRDHFRDCEVEEDDED